VLAAVTGRLGVPVSGAEHPDLSGTWTLNGGQSDMPAEVGFDPDWHDSESTSAGSTGGGRSSGGGGGGGGRGGGRGSGGGGGRAGGSGPIATNFESEDDAKKIRELMAEAKDPSASLTITQTDGAIAIADVNGRVRTYHPNGKEETVRLASGGGLGAVTTWGPANLSVRYLVEKNRELRFTFARAAGVRQLLVTTQFADHGRGQIIKRVYE